jgi:hypothetical protein
MTVLCEYQDYPVVCGEQCCAAGLECLEGDICSCLEGYPVDCGDMCCLEGNTCEAETCTASCPADAPKACDDGLYCCPEGTECDGEGCSCPEENPVECGELCGEPDSICFQGEPTLFECPTGWGVHCGNYCCLDGAECTISMEPCSCPADLPVDCGEYCCSADQVCVDNECIKVSGGGDGCNSNADCAGFGSRHCDAQAICDPAAGLCHCCMPFCQGSSCSCQSCSACSGDPNTRCLDNVCVFKLGGKPSD